MQDTTKEKVKLFSIIALIILILVFGLIFRFSDNSRQKIFSMVGLNKSNSQIDDFEVDFLNVGQGDCSLISINDKNILIDTGDEIYSEKVISFLHENDVKKLDYIIISHPHLDHIGGAYNIINSIETSKIIINNIPGEKADDEYDIEAFNEFIESKNIEIIHPENLEEIKIDELKFKFFSFDDYDNLNDSSLVIQFEYSGKMFTFTGDIEENAEEYLSTFLSKTDVLKVAHHGSNTSSTALFLEAISPEIFFISCGEDNNFKHPSDEVVKRLSFYSNNIFRTDLFGDMKLTIENKQIKIQTEKSGNYVID